MEPTPVAMEIRGGLPACHVGYAGAAVMHPATLFALGAGLGLGILAGSILAATASLVVLVTIAWAVSTTGPFQRLVDAQRRERARQRRRQLREQRLTLAGIGRDQLLELTALADDIEHNDPGLAARFEVEELLDHHVATAVSYERCLRAMRMADRGQLTMMLAGPTGATGRRSRFLQRRLRYWDHCKAEADRCVEELAATAEFVRLLAQKAACPELRFDEEALERRMADLEEEESAYRQLAAR
jgi:NhaP-type Na+/H+ or K+/H+ antiporter